MTHAMQRLQEEMGHCTLVVYLCKDLAKAPLEMYYLWGGFRVGQRPAKAKTVVSQVGLEKCLRVNWMDWKGALSRGRGCRGHGAGKVHGVFREHLSESAAR